MAAGVFGDFTNAVLAVRILGVIALVLWLAAASVFIYAVSGRVSSPSGNARDLTTFVVTVVNSITTARKEVDNRAASAQRVTVAAVVFTGAALTTAALYPSRTTEVIANVLLAPSGVSAVAAICPARETILRGRIDPSALDHSTVTVVTLAGSCGHARATLHIRSRDVLAIAQDDELPQAPTPSRRVAQIELTTRGRERLRHALGPRCHVDDLRAVIVGGPARAPTVITFPRPNCRGLRLRLPPSLGVIDQKLVAWPRKCIAGSGRGTGQRHCRVKTRGAPRCDLRNAACAASAT